MDSAVGFYREDHTRRPVLGVLYSIHGVHVCVYVSSTLDYCSFVEVLESGSVSTSFVLFEDYLGYLDHLRFHMYGFFYFCKRSWGF